MTVQPVIEPAPATTSMLVLEDVNTYYGNIHALRGISLNVEQGEIVTLIGANGAGKTTTLKTISGLLHPRTGRVLFEGQDVSRTAAWIVRTGRGPRTRRTTTPGWRLASPISGIRQTPSPAATKPWAVV